MADINDDSNEIEKVNAVAEPEFDVKVEDDTPPEDRGRTPLPQNLVEELDKDDLEEYSDKVKKRLSQMKKVWHDERREKEAMAREREEAIRFAQAQVEENKKLKERLGVGQRAYLNEVVKSTKQELEQTKAKLRQAYEKGDSDEIAAAQEEMTEIKIRMREFERARPSLQSQENSVQQPPQNQQPRASAPQPQQPVEPDHKALAWREKNTWFGPNTEMTALALGVHEKLVRSGVDPKSDEYYDYINNAMRQRFPEAFDNAEDEPQTEQVKEKPVVRTKPANVVAPATRSTAPRQVRLTATQVAIAKKLGLSNEQYARELMKLETN